MENLGCYLADPANLAFLRLELLNRHHHQIHSMFVYLYSSVRSHLVQ